MYNPISKLLKRAKGIYIKSSFSNIQNWFMLGS